MKVSWRVASLNDAESEEMVPPMLLLMYEPAGGCGSPAVKFHPDLIDCVRNGAEKAGFAQPLLQGVDPAQRLQELLRIREPLYREIADFTISTNRRRIQPKLLLWGLGLLMGWGSALIPGGNDGLVLVGMPLGWPYAWLAFGTMVLSIAAALRLQGALAR